MTASSHDSGRSPLMSPFCSGWRKHATDGGARAGNQHRTRGGGTNGIAPFFPPRHRLLPQGFWEPPLTACVRPLRRGTHRAYLYTGRGPSAQSMHIGHVIPFLLTRYLQDALGLPLVIQITDDEKHFFRDIPVSGERASGLVVENIKDIIAFGFDPRRHLYSATRCTWGHVPNCRAGAAHVDAERCEEYIWPEG
ncbi:putative tryptophanyl-tRNA synthetase [Trypanosoma cruzi]|uniref:Tryptophanyl-tRNA synthetase n=1 Tax=Trypanosoma cruzi TaxID=5693 RepID=A0A2V2VF02_TRYCR|nr:putative tryptophanyl-tRNA synthetase [Trypanosoma cruzi]